MNGIINVSIIIVNYNTSSLLRNCIESIYKETKEIEFEIIVSDNGSTDGSCEMLKKEFPDVILIENNKNLGFGAANNKGLAIAKGKYIFYLNSDTKLLNNAVKYFYDYYESNENQNIGALGSNLLNENQKVIHSYGNFTGYKQNLKELFVMFFSNIILTFFTIIHVFPKSLLKLKETNNFFTGEVDYVTGADLFMLNNEDAYYDENFLLYFEDNDLQRRLSLKNKKRIIIDGPKIVHLCGGSVGEKYTIFRKSSFSRIQFEISRIQYLSKYYKNPVLKFITKLQITIIWLNPFLLPKTFKQIGKIWKL